MPDPNDSKDNQTDSDKKDDQTDSKDNPNGNPTNEDIKNLQKIVSEKDVKLQDALSKIAKIEKDSKDDPNSKESDVLKQLHETIKTMSDDLNTMRTDKERADLQKLYPDIMPDVLIGKDKETQQKIVDEQRRISKKLYGDSAKFVQPTYENSDEVDKEIDAVKKDDKLSGENAARKVLGYIREKSRFK